MFTRILDCALEQVSRLLISFWKSVFLNEITAFLECEPCPRMFDFSILPQQEGWWEYKYKYTILEGTLYF